MTDELREALPLIRRAIWRYMNYCYEMANMMAQKTSRDSRGNPYPASAVSEALNEAEKAESLLEVLRREKDYQRLLRAAKRGTAK